MTSPAQLQLRLPRGLPQTTVEWQELQDDDPDLYRKLQHHLDTIGELHTADHRQPIPDSPGALAAQCTSGREHQRAHLDLIDAELRACRDGHADRVGIFMPPQVGKSRRVSEWGAAWLLSTRPDWRVAVASYAAHLARKRGRFVRNLLTAHPELGLTVARGSAAVDDWDLDGHRGGMKSVGVGGGLTGDPVDAGIIDDPVKDRQEADSSVVREAVYGWYRDVFEMRMGPTGFIVLMMTRWHEDDLGGRLIAEEGTVQNGGRWRIVNAPALAEPHQPVKHPETGEIVGACPCGRPLDEPHDPLGRAVGEPIPHPTMDPQEYRRRAERTRVVSPRTFAALLQQRPTPLEGGLVGHDLLRKIRVPADQLPEMRRRIVALDPSGGGQDEAGVVAGGLGIDARAYLTHDRSARMSAAEWGRAACQLAHEIGADAFVVEKNYGGDQAGTIVRQAWAALEIEGALSGLCPRIVEVSAKKGKVARAEPVAQAMREDRVGLAGVFPELEEQWATYQQGMDSPDRLDASVYLVTELLPRILSGPRSIASPSARALPIRAARR